MDKINQSEKNKNWQLLIEEQEKSGLSRAAFCQERNLVLSQFTYYYKKFKVEPNGNGFASIKLSPATGSLKTEVRVILPNGFQCFIPTLMDKSQLKALLEIFLSC